MGYAIGGLVGGTIIVCLIALAFGRFAFRRHRPGSRAGLAAVFSYLTCSVLAGFGMADGAGFTLRGFFVYAIPAIVAFGLLFWRYRSRWTDNAPADHFE